MAGSSARSSAVTTIDESASNGAITPGLRVGNASTRAILRELGRLTARVKVRRNGVAAALS